MGLQWDCILVGLQWDCNGIETWWNSMRINSGGITKGVMKMKIKSQNKTYNFELKRNKT